MKWKARKALAYGLATVVIFIAACSTSGKANTDNYAGKKGDSAKMKTELLKFRIEDVNALPSNVKKAVDSLLETKQQGSRLVADKERTFLAVSIGERPTGGYSVNVKRIAKGNDTLYVDAIEEQPPQGAVVTQVLTYPYTVVSVPGDYTSYALNIRLRQTIDPAQPS